MDYYGDCMEQKQKVDEKLKNFTFWTMLLYTHILCAVFQHGCDKQPFTMATYLLPLGCYPAWLL